MTSAKVGQEFGAIRSSLPLDKLEPFLQKNVVGYIGPLEVQQFKFGQVRYVFHPYMIHERD